MKSLFVIALILVTTRSFTQDFSPFNAKNPKRFVNPLNSSDNDYYFHSVNTSQTLGEQIVFKQYARKTNNYTYGYVPGCYSWGNDFILADTTTWLGRKVIYDFVSKELLVNSSKFDTLNFDFGIDLTDSSKFFSTQSGDYFIRYDKIIQETIMGAPDLVKTFSIWKYDSNKNLVVSPLNGFEIKLGEKLGLASFIVCNGFPSIEKGLNIMGQLNPTLGYYQLTYDEVFPWKQGDTLEYLGFRSSNIGAVVRSHSLITVENRIETSDSVWIYFKYKQQLDSFPSYYPSYTFPSSYNIGYFNPIVFKKGENLNDIPNRATDGNTTYNYSYSNFGELKKSMSYYEENIFYCDNGNCFGYFDGDGSIYSSQQYVEGLGVTFSGYRSYGSYSGPEARLIYSSVGGVRWGEYKALDLEELKISNNRKLLKIVDILGREIESTTNTVLIYVYSDGTTEKKVLVE